MLRVFLGGAWRSLFGSGERLFAHNFFSGPGAPGWIAFVLVQPALIFLFSRGERGKGSPLLGPWAFTAALILLGLLSSSGRAGAGGLGLSESWVSLAGLAPLFAALILLSLGLTPPGPRIRPYFPPAPGGRLLSFGLPLALSLILGLWFLVTLFMPGNPAPLPLYLPLLNPLDLLEAFSAVVILLWLQRRAGAGGAGPWARRLPALGGDIMLFLWLLAVLGRSFHFFGTLPWAELFSRGSFHLALFIYLAAYGILHIIGGHRFSRRSLWIAGAILTVLDIVKLLVFDLSGTGAIPRIASFFIAGLALLFIGWAAPLPPRKTPSPQKPEPR
jgi:uncharacterized membrane protein